MPDLADLILLDKHVLWDRLDSIWRERVTQSRSDFIRFLTYARLVGQSLLYAKLQHYRRAQTTPTAEPFMTLPVWPIVIDEAALAQAGYVTFGSGYHFADPKEIVFGQLEDAAFDFPLGVTVDSIGAITSGLVESATVLTPLSFTFDKERQRVRFDDNPFNLFASRTVPDSDARYIVAWLRNVRVDLQTLYNQTGWTLGIRGESSEAYRDVLDTFWDVQLRGPSLSGLRAALSASSNLPIAKQDGEVVERIVSDGSGTAVITDKRVYKAPPATSSVVAEGDVLRRGDAVFDAIKVYDRAEAWTVPYGELPGIVLTTAAGVVVLRNEELTWSYDPALDSPWRFPVDGAVDAVEAFWTACWARQQASGVYLNAIFGLTLLGPNPAVNPARLVLQHIIGTNVTVVTRPVTLDKAVQVYGRLARHLDASTYMILHENVGGASDSIDLAAVTASSGAACTYNASAATDTISVSGTDLTYSDYAPMVAIA